MRHLNILSMMVDATRDITALDDTVVVINVITPGVGEVSNYIDTNNNSIAISWSIVAFNSTSLLAQKEYAYAPALPVSIFLDEALIGNAPAGDNEATLNLSTLPALDRRYPHRLNIVADAPHAGSTAHLTRYPCSLDVFDETVPLSRDTAVPTSGSIMLHLPESVW